MGKKYSFGLAKLINTDIETFKDISPFHLLVFSHMCFLCDDKGGGVYKWYPQYLATQFLPFSKSYKSSYRQIMRLIPALENRKIPLIKPFKPDLKKVKFLLLLPNHKEYLPEDGKGFEKKEKLKQKMGLIDENPIFRTAEYNQKFIDDPKANHV